MSNTRSGSPRHKKTRGLRLSSREQRLQRVSASSGLVRKRLSHKRTEESPSERKIGWVADDEGYAGSNSQASLELPLTAQVLALFGEQDVRWISVLSASKALARARQDVENAVETLLQAGELFPLPGNPGRFKVSPERKSELESLFRETARELGEESGLVAYESDDPFLLDGEDEPRLPVTAGLLSLFLPGTGQLLNGDVGRASLVFAVWSLALLTGFPPIWTFVHLYAGAEAFFTAKIRGIERKIAIDAPSSPQALESGSHRKRSLKTS